MTLKAHSPRELNLFIATRSCVCGGETEMAVQGIFVVNGSLEERRLVKCRKCGKKVVFSFRVTAGADTPWKAVNPTAEPSELLDVTQWAIYVYYYMEQFAAADRRHDEPKQYEALSEISKGLHEILKFYPDGEADPPSAALFSENSRRRYDALRPWFRRENLERILRTVEHDLARHGALS